MTNSTNQSNKLTDIEDGVLITAGYVPTGHESQEQRLRAVEEPIRPLPMTPEQFVSLPLWARVAFGVRCASRVLPLYRHFCPLTLRAEVLPLVEAIEIAERSAASAHSFLADEAATQAAQYMEDYDDGFVKSYRSQIVERYEWLQKCRRAVPGVASVADIVGNAAIASLYASKLDVDPLDHGGEYYLKAHYQPRPVGAVRVMFIAEQTYRLLVSVGSFGTVWNLAAPSRDLAKLLKLVKAEGWTDETPIPSAVFGPMWEGKPPSWWRDDVLADLPEPAPQPASNATA